MIWTPDQLTKLEAARKSAAALSRQIQQLAESIPLDAYGRDSLIAANEQLAGAEENIAEVLDHAKTAKEFTDAVSVLGGE